MKQASAARRRLKVASMVDEREGLVKCEFCDDLMPRRSMSYHVSSCQRLPVTQRRLSALNRRRRLRADGIEVGALPDGLRLPSDFPDAGGPPAPVEARDEVRDADDAEHAAGAEGDAATAAERPRRR